MALLLAAFALAAPPRSIGGRLRPATPVAGRPSVANCTWQNFTQVVDHFGNAPGTFPQRLCIYDKYWAGADKGGFKAPTGAPGPILFYTGNESPVEEYINNTGLMWEIAEGLGALIVFAEHRFEPLSHPSLNGPGTQNCFSYCTTAQAIADWVTILASLRKQHAIRAPAVAFGGSYGGMIAGWFRMKYPEVIDGVIAASAPIWQLSSTVERETLDMGAVAISRGVSAVGGATDQCRDNLRAAWPLLKEAGKTQAGLWLLGNASKQCHPLGNEDALPRWAQNPYFAMAEGNYPFPSTYITYSLKPGNPNPLPAWPMRVACEAGGLNQDLGLKMEGNYSDVKYSLTMGALKVDVDWGASSGNGPSLTLAQLKDSGIEKLAAGVAAAAGVWYNLTQDLPCFGGDEASSAEEVQTEEVRTEEVLEGGSEFCPACPPCDDCPPCPVSFCNYQDTNQCSMTEPLGKTFSWGAVCCNDQLSQIFIRGAGRDIFWPPGVADRNYTVESVVGPKEIKAGGCPQNGPLRGGPLISDRWSTWMDAYYGGRNISHHRNIVWSNGALDPWSGQGVYPPGGGSDGAMVQNISADGSQVALLLDLGAHHLDLMFSDPRNPPCFAKARAIEERMIKEWIQEAYDSI